MITVLMATYQGEKYLKPQLDSILSQSFSDFKLVISDDVSSDSTREIVSEYAKKYPGKVIPVFPEKASGSAENNFFSMLEKADDDYIMLSDQDDVWLPDKIEKTFEKMKEAENIYGKNTPILIHSNLKVTDGELNIIAESFWKYQNISPERTKLNQMLVQNGITGCTMMINRALLKYLWDYTPKECAMHDWWCGLIACSFGHIDYITDSLMLYRQHGNNQVGAKNARSFSFIWGKYKSRDIVKENYNKMFIQARLFEEKYQDTLTDTQKDILKGFIDIQGASRIFKVKTIIKYKFYKNNFVRTMGQFFSI